MLRLNLLCLALVSSVSSLVWADGGNKDSRQNPPPNPDKVIEFVSEHHAELKTILVYLRDSRPGEFDKAVRDLSRVNHRLEQLKKRDNRRYELELESWKHQSKIQLLAAKIRMNPSDELVAELREHLTRKVELRGELMRYSRDRMSQRAAKIDEQIDKLESNREQLIDKQIRVLTSVKKNTTKKLKLGVSSNR